MNMDIKDLIAKLKKGKSSGTGRRSGGLVAFFDKNPKMKIIIPAILLAIAVLASIVIIATTSKNPIKDNTPVNSNNAGDKIDVLPKDVRDLEEIEIGGDNVFDEIDVAHAKITAIMVNSDGYYTATMVTDKQSYPHLQVGDYIGGSSWLVENITDDEVVIALGEKKVEIKY